MRWHSPLDLILPFIGDAWIAANFSQALMNSLMITVISVVLIVLISSLAAFAFAVMDFKGKNALYLFHFGWTNYLCPDYFDSPILNV